MQRHHHQGRAQHTRLQDASPPHACLILSPEQHLFPSCFRARDHWVTDARESLFWSNGIQSRNSFLFRFLLRAAHVGRSGQVKPRLGLAGAGCPSLQLQVHGQREGGQAHRGQRCRDHPPFRQESLRAASLLHPSSRLGRLTRWYGHAMFGWGGDAVAVCVCVCLCLCLCLCVCVCLFMRWVSRLSCEWISGADVCAVICARIRPSMFVRAGQFLTCLARPDDCCRFGNWNRGRRTLKLRRR